MQESLSRFVALVIENSDIRSKFLVKTNENLMNFLNVFKLHYTLHTLSALNKPALAVVIMRCMIW